MRKAVLLLFLILMTASAIAYEKDSTCVNCHGDEILMKKLGYPQLYLDPAEVDKEVNMGGISCVSCHLGDNTKMNKDDAHKDMPRPFYAAAGKKYKYQAVGREITNYDPIQPKGNNRTKVLLRKPDPKMAKEKGIKKIIQLFYHDHDPKTMAYSPDIARKTCGQCHEQEVEDYNKSGMGLNKYQRGFKSWTASPPGPQNCGYWFGDKENYETVKNEECTKPEEYKGTMAQASGRGCNKCHASCNDCHYEGYKKTAARHSFTKDPDKLTCYGSGKGTICHAGPMDRRRGAGFFRQEFAFPVNELPRDAHEQAGLTCNDCHTFKDHTYGHIGSEDARKSCQNCHSEIYEAVKAGDHQSVDCSSCHIQEVGAYQFTFWGPGKSEAMPNMFSKHKQFYGKRDKPMLVKHPETGLWIPLKPYPMGTMNIKNDIGQEKLKLRTIEKTTVKGVTDVGEPESFVVERRADQVNDMYIITGTHGGFEGNDKMLAWIQMDKMSHSIGKARDCDSCHSSHEQKATSWYTYFNPSDVTKPFHGSYTVTAGKNGITFDNFTNTKVSLAKGRKISDFAPYLINNTLWNAKGVDLELKFDDEKYADGRSEYLQMSAKLHHMISKEKNAEKKERLKLIRTVLSHNADYAKKMLSEMK